MDQQAELDRIENRREWKSYRGECGCTMSLAFKWIKGTDGLRWVPVAGNFEQSMFDGCTDKHDVEEEVTLFPDD